MKATAGSTALLTGVFALLYRLFGMGWLLSTAITCGTVCYHFAMRLLVGALVPNTFDPAAKWFQPRPWEAALYRRLQVKAWKSHVPTYDPRRFSFRENTPTEVAANMCQAEVVHEVIVLLSFLPLAFSLVFGSFPVFLITSILSAALDLVFVALQRCNRPRLMRLIQKQLLTTRRDPA